VSATKRFFLTVFFSPEKMPLKNRPRDAKLARVVAKWRHRPCAERCSVSELAQNCQVSRFVMMRFVNDHRRKKCRKYCEGAELYARRKNVSSAVELHATAKYHSYRTVARMRQKVYQKGRARERRQRRKNFVSASEIPIYCLQGQQWSSYCASQSNW